MAVEILVPEMGESILEATVHQWFKEEGERVEIGEALVELETDKVNLEVGAERSGVLSRVDFHAGDDVKVGDVLGIIEEIESARVDGGTSGEEEPPQDETENSLKSMEKKQPESDQKDIKPQGIAVTPLAERFAREQKVDLNAVTGSGPGGRITKSDILRYLKEDQKSAKPKTGQIDLAAPPPPQIESDYRRVERLKMSRRRRTIANRLVEAQKTAAMLTTFNEIDMSAVMELRKRRNPEFMEKHGVKIGITSFFVKAVVSALKAFPRLNAEIEGEEMILKHYYDIGIAIGAEEGLVVPVLRDADRLSFAEIEKKINGFVEAVQEKNLSLEDLRGGTFSITNGGVFGSLLSTPILNPPQVGILGLHKIEPRPIAVEDELKIRPMMYVAVSYDHRIVDGREAVQFLVRIKELIEDPEMLLLEG
jgi:2-oxoglutarate dehydrogenase E2 component (dihydrolipoamide succinyltransferase)